MSKVRADTTAPHRMPPRNREYALFVGYVFDKHSFLRQYCKLNFTEFGHKEAFHPAPNRRNPKATKNTMNHSILRALAALWLGAGFAGAEIITQTQSVGAHVPAGNKVLTFDKFDTTLGSLDSIQIILSLSIWGGSLAIVNESALQVTGMGSFGVNAALLSPNVILSNGAVDPLTHGPYNPWKEGAKVSHLFDLVPAQRDEVTGPTYIDRLTVSANDFVANNFYSGYQTEGYGSFDVTYASTALTELVSGGISYSGTPASAEGYVTVIYNYTPVPEPTTGALAGFAALMLLRRRRRA